MSSIDAAQVALHFGDNSLANETAVSETLVSF